ncbi:MAG: hypothetical protein M1833_000290 [Piccolia ochrophora]|nr:MAG: hypothetical protein M1833_000290 [Piccolia ochrophora]
MIGTSVPAYILIFTSSAFLRLVTPLSICYCALRPFFRLPLLFLAVDVWAISETCFYFLVYHPMRLHLQNPTTHPPLRSREERRELFRRCQDNMPDPEKFLSKWFLDAPLSDIKRDNVKEFYSWAFLDTDTPKPDDDEELEEYVDGIEETLGRRIEPGRGKAKCLRLTLDKVDMRHRPLIWYLAVFVVDNTTHLFMLWHGFHYYRTRLGPFPPILPSRPQTWLSPNRSPAEQLSYWHRPHTSKKKLPILFIHGIGIGLYPYVPFLAGLNRNADPDDDDDGQVGIIAVEILPVSFRMTHKALGRTEMCRQIETILLRHGFEKVVVVSHSYGSVITTHLLQDPQISMHVASVVLVDPVSILLHLPDVAYNFTYRTPRAANELQLWYFASKDMAVAHTLSRSFFWAENILWIEDAGTRPLSVFLGGRDLIVDTAQVWRYLTTGRAGPGGGKGVNEEKEDEMKRDPKGWVGGDEGRLKVVWCDEADHAQIFDRKERLDGLVREVRRHSRMGRPE